MSDWAMSLLCRTLLKIARAWVKLKISGVGSVALAELED